VNLVWSVVIVIAVAAAAVGGILLVRRRAPDGGYFNDGDRAAGVFGVLATGFAILLGLIVVLAFTNYDESRIGAETEALLVAQQFETAQFLPPDAREPIGGELACYARSVVHQEWPRLEEDTQGDTINPWAVALFETLQEVEPERASEEAAFGKWLDQNSDREQARQDRVHGAAGVIPSPLWLVLFVTAVVLFVFMLFFADRGERAVVQGLLIGAVAVVVTATLLLIGYLDSPYRPGPAGLQPVAMERTLGLLDQQREVVGGGDLPCDEQGIPT
jgi:hypothetical protein